MKKDPENILVIRLSSIGDILLTTPLIRLLRRRFPNARIDYLVKEQFAALLRTSPYIDELYTLDTRQGHSALKRLYRSLLKSGYDLVVDVHNNFRSAYLRRLRGARVVKLRKYKLQRFVLVKFGWNFYSSVRPVHQRYIDTVAGFGIHDDRLGLEFFPDPEAQRRVDDLLKQKGWNAGKATIAIVPGASKETKRWPVERFDKAAQQLGAEFDAQILLLGDTRDARLTDILRQSLGNAAIDFAGKLDIMESACALNRAHLALTNDSGLMHMAAALDKPVVSIFGSTVRELGFFPVGRRTVVIENNNLSCRPCTHIGRASCPKKHFKCMQDIDADEVFQAAAELLHESLP